MAAVPGTQHRARRPTGAGGPHTPVGQGKPHQGTFQVWQVKPGCRGKLADVDNRIG